MNHTNFSCNSSEEINNYHKIHQANVKTEYRISNLSGKYFNNVSVANDIEMFVRIF